MRHNNSGRKLGRNAPHRKAMFRNMARALLTYERIRTTEAKAKELRKVVENLVTLALRNDLHSRRLAFKVLENHTLVVKLFEEIGPRFVGVPGGFTRVVKLGEPRTGDCAAMAVIELTRQAGEETKEETKPKKAKAEKPKAAEKAAEPVVEAAPEPVAAEDLEPVVEVPEERPAPEKDEKSKQEGGE